MLSFCVIIPTLREEEGIGALLQALKAQDYAGEVEIIVVDGHSEDQTQNIVGTFPDVVLLLEKRGTSRQRNRGAKEARGELLVFLDADNLPSNNFLSRIATSYNRLPFAVACPWFWARDSLPIAALYCGFNILFWLGQGWLQTGSGVCLIAPKQVFDLVGGFDEKLHLGEDIHFIRRAARHGLHRHLLIPLRTSGRRFKQKGVYKLMWFYVRITPLILCGRWNQLQKQSYEAAPYQPKDPDKSF